MSKRRYAAWGIDGSFKYKWVANMVKWWKTGKAEPYLKLAIAGLIILWCFGFAAYFK